MRFLGSTINYNKGNISYPISITANYADSYHIYDEVGNDVTDNELFQAGTYTLVISPSMGCTINGVHYENSPAIFTVNDSITILVDEPEATSSLVYRLSDDETYYVVGNYYNNIFDIKRNYMAPADEDYGNGLDETWQGGALVIPNTYNGKPVKAICPAAFGNVTNITSFNIANGVSIIGDRAFQVASTSPNFPDTTLTNYRFPNDLEFLGQENHRMFLVDATWNYIPSWQYSNSQNMYACDAGGAGRVMWGRAGITEIKIPECYDIIPQSTFAYCTGLGNELVLPNHIKSIYNYAFQYCTSFQVLNFPAGLEYTTSSSFYGCDNVKDILIAANSNAKYIYPYVQKSNGEYVDETKYTYYLETEDATYIGSADNPYLILHDVVADSSTTSYTIREGVQVMIVEKFRNNTNLISINFPVTLKSINSSAFSGCTGLTSITLPENLAYIANNAFVNVRASINVPQHLEYIGSGAFGSCVAQQAIFDALESGAYLPSSTTSIIMRNSCKLLAIQSNFSANLDNIQLCDSIQYMSGGFSNCTNLTSITLPKDLLYLGQLFYNCTNLTNVTFNDKLLYIGSGSVFYNTKISVLNLPASLQCLPTNVFQNMSYLTTVTIPDLTNKLGFSGSNKFVLGYRAFYNCNNLSSATFTNPNNWYVSTSTGASSGTNLSASNLSDTSTAARYLRNTYRDYYWYRNQQS